MDEYSKFDTLYTKLNSIYKAANESFDHYFTCRFVGKTTKAYLAPNFNRDVIFVDLHVQKGLTNSEEFLKELEKEAILTCKARVHWGKAFFSNYQNILPTYPKENITAFLQVKKALDPFNTFSSQYTQRVLNI